MNHWREDAAGTEADGTSEVLLVVAQEEVESIVRSLRSHQGLAALSAHPPGAMLMPFRKSASEVYLAVAVALPVSSVCLHNLWVASNAVLNTVLETSVAGQVRAIEVLLFAAKGDITERVLRVSVYEAAYQHPYLPTANALLNRTSLEGVTCGWYWKKDRVPAEPPPPLAEEK